MERRLSQSEDRLVKQSDSVTDHPYNSGGEANWTAGRHATSGVPDTSERGQLLKAINNMEWMPESWKQTYRERHLVDASASLDRNRENSPVNTNTELHAPELDQLLDRFLDRFQIIRDNQRSPEDDPELMQLRDRFLDRFQIIRDNQRSPEDDPELMRLRDRFLDRLQIISSDDPELDQLQKHFEISSRDEQSMDLPINTIRTLREESKMHYDNTKIVLSILEAIYEKDKSGTSSLVQDTQQKTISAVVERESPDRTVMSQEGSQTPVERPDAGEEKPVVVETTENPDRTVMSQERRQTPVERPNAGEEEPAVVGTTENPDRTVMSQERRQTPVERPDAGEEEDRVIGGEIGVMMDDNIKNLLNRGNEEEIYSSDIYGSDTRRSKLLGRRGGKRSTAP